MALTREEVADIAHQVAHKVVYKKIEKVVDGQTVECDICSNDEELYHLTSVDTLRTILDSRKMEPVGESKSVSMSANPDNTFGGRTKVTFDKTKLNSLQPMAYFTHDSPAQKAYWEIEEKRKKESNYARTLDDIRSEVGMQPEIYKQECEWFSREMLPIPKESLKKIEYFITPPMSPLRVDCVGYFPHRVDLTQDYLYQGLLEDIAKVREMAQKASIPFAVTSCFPYIIRGWGQYIELNDENLWRFTRGEEPVITHQEPKDECPDVRGCGRK